MKKYRTDIIVIAISILISLISFGIYPVLNSVYARSDDIGGKVIIEVNNELYGEYDLSINQTIDVKSEFGNNRVKIENGRAFVIDADCPDKLCVNDSQNSGFLGEIICLPNRMVLRIESSRNEEEPDAIAY